VATGRGTAEPAADNTEESGRRLNRRVDFVVRLKKEP
jgi:outer membrane protein OmpA-like peptidoglycan-associated protein